VTTATNLLVILGFLSALYTLLGVLCAAAEQASSLWARRPVRRRCRPSTGDGDRRHARRRRPERPAVNLGCHRRA
jgi:hypothetical protein